MAAPPRVALAPERPTTFNICLSSVSQTLRTDGNELFSCWGYIQSMRLNSNTHGHVVSVAIEFYGLGMSRTRGVDIEVPRPRALADADWHGAHANDGCRARSWRKLAGSDGYYRRRIRPVPDSHRRARGGTREAREYIFFRSCVS